MSWFRSKAQPQAPPPEKTDSYGAASSGEAVDDQTFSSSNFSDASNSPASYADNSNKRMTQLNQAAVEQLVAQEQARQAQMAFLAKMTEIAFEKCITKPDTTLSSKESECIAATLHKYVDAQKFVVGRYSRQQQAQQSLN